MNFDSGHRRHNTQYRLCGELPPAPNGVGSEFRWQSNAQKLQFEDEILPDKLNFVEFRIRYCLCDVKCGVLNDHLHGAG